MANIWKYLDLGHQASCPIYDDVKRYYIFLTNCSVHLLQRIFAYDEAQRYHIDFSQIYTSDLLCFYHKRFGLT